MSNQTDIVKYNNELVVLEEGYNGDAPISIGALEIESSDNGGGYVKPYYSHLQCKKSKGKFEIYKAVPKSQNIEGMISINTGVTPIVALEGDIVSTNYGFALSVNGFNDKLEGESPFRCQTYKVKLVDSNGEVVVTNIYNKPLSKPFFVYQPYQSKSEPNIPNKELVKELKGGYKREVYGSVDKVYAERVGIERERKCVECIYNGTHIAEDTSANKEGKLEKSYCSMTGELFFYVRKIGMVVTNAEGEGELKFFDIGKKNLGEYLAEHSIITIPLGRVDVNYGLNNNKPFSISIDFNDPRCEFIPRDALPFGKYLDTIRTKYSSKVTTRAYFPGLGDMSRPAEFIQVPTRLYLVDCKENRAEGLTVPSTCMVASTVKEDLHKGTDYAKMAWLRYYYEKQLAAGLLTPLESNDEDTLANTTITNSIDSSLESKLSELSSHNLSIPSSSNSNTDNSNNTIGTTKTTDTNDINVSSTLKENSINSINGSKQLTESISWTANKSSRKSNPVL